MRTAWKEAGRAGDPRLVSPRYFALGSDARETAEANVRAYYSFGGEAMVKGLLQSLLSTPDSIRRSIDELEKIGVDEAFFWPMNADQRQVERLEQALR